MCISIDIYDDLSILVHMNSGTTDTERLLQLAREQGAFRLRDVRARGVHPEVVYRALRAGRVERVGRDLYRGGEAGAITEKHNLVLAAKAVPKGVICLLSALDFHQLTTQLPFKTWVAIDRRAAQPRVHDLPLRIMRFSRPALDMGVEEHVLEGVPVRVYSAVKTVVDCFRCRHEVGIDVAIEALRDCRAQRKGTPSELWEMAVTCRVGSVMRAYIEAIG
jgi:predicted transcriptional regulator of viral defense system